MSSSNLKLSPEFWSTVNLAPEKTLVVGFVYGGLSETGRKPQRPLLKPTADWLTANFPSDNIIGINHGPLVCARNTAIRDLVIRDAVTMGRKFDWFFSVDNDVTITVPGITHFLKVQADVVSCDCQMRNSRAWEESRSFHTPMWFCRTKVLEAIEPPWFDFVYSPDMCEVRACECLYFRDKAIEAGFSVAHGGHCGHGNHGTAWSTDLHEESTGELPDLGLLGGE